MRRILKLDLRVYKDLHKIEKTMADLRRLADKPTTHHADQTLCRDVANIIEHIRDSLMDQAILHWSDSYRHKRMAQLQESRAKGEK